MNFSQLGLSPAILDAVSEQGYTVPSPIQEKAMTADYRSWEPKEFKLERISNTFRANIKYLPSSINSFGGKIESFPNVVFSWTWEFQPKSRRNRFLV